MDALPYYKWLWIDYRANRKVQRMPWQARGLYRELLDEFWSEGSLPDDTERLAEVCGCTTEEFEQHWPVIRPCFTVQDGVLINAKMDEQRTAVDTSRIAKARAGAKGGKASNSFTRSKQTQESAKQVLPDAKQVQAQPDIAEQSKAEHKQEKVPSRDKRECDARHVPFKVAIDAYAAFKHIKLAWDGSEAKALDLLLKSLPEMTLLEFQACLNNRARSPGTPHGERPRVWLPHIAKYQQGPLNEFGKTGEVNGKFAGKTESSLDAASQALAVIAGREASGYYETPGEAGDTQAGEARHGRLLGAG